MAGITGTGVEAARKTSPDAAAPGPSPGAMEIDVATRGDEAFEAAHLGAVSPVIVGAMPLGCLVEDLSGSAWINSELARIWRWDLPGPPPAGAFQRDLQAMNGAPSEEGLVRAAFGATVGMGRWRPYILRRQDETTAPVRVARRSLRIESGAIVDVTYVTDSGPREPDTRLRRAFLAMIGHELRTPISSIVAGAELLHSADLHEPTRDEVTALLVEEANRVNLLVEQLTWLTLLQAHNSMPEFEPVHMVHLARSVGAREARRRPGLRLRLPTLGAGGAIALGDEGFVAQVLTILIDNAGKYAGPTGDVEIVVEQVGVEIVAHVLDRGPGLQGIDPERLFDLFQRAPLHGADVRGTGVGLYVARQIIEAMHGRIWAADRRDGGADFGFALSAAT